MKNIYQSLRLLSMFLLLLGSVSSFAQDKRTVKGTIKDPTGAPMPFVNVVIKGSTISAVTDVDGNFSIEASKEDVLVVSFISYKTQEIVVGDQTSVSVTLEEDVKVLDEVVATGYSQMKRTDLTSAQVSVSAKQIEQTINTSFDQAIQGRAAGVQVTQNSGQPGGGVSINIRGTSTMGGNTQPLYVIDGVQMTGQEGGNQFGVGYGSASSANPLSFINPSDIESLEILQGPSATAIYGSRATNGVVLVTTKRGKSGKMKVDYSLIYTSQDTPKQLPTMNLQQYAQFRNDWAAAGGIASQTEFANPSILGNGTNWQNELFKTAPYMKHQLSLSGGNDKTTYYLSGEYLKQNGVVVGSDFNRYGIRLNVDSKVFKFLNFNQSLGLSRTSELLNSSADGIINTALTQNPGVAARNPDGSFGGPATQTFQLTNPLGLATINDKTKTSNNIYGTIGLEFKILKGLTFKTNFSGGTNFATLDEWEPSYQFGSYKVDITKSTRSTFYTSNYNINQILTYNRKFATKHDVTLMAGHEAIYSQYENLSGSRNGFSTNLIQELNGGVNASLPTSGRGNAALESYFGRFNYIYNDKYILQASLRNDGSSTFGPDNKWGMFPAVSAGWRISQEPFLKNVKQISELKLRVEYGKTGNSGWGTPYLSTLTPGISPWMVTYRPSRYPNSSVKWESTTTFNVGANVSLFNNRIEFIGDYYIKSTDNLLQQPTFPYYMGIDGASQVAAPTVNVGSLRNEGVALTLNAVPIEKPFSWKTSMNWSLNKNKITQLYNASDALDRTNWTMPSMVERSQVGYPTNQMMGYEYVGLIQNYAQLMDTLTAVPEANKNSRDPNHTYVGDVLWKDQNGDHVINTKDLKVIGNPNPLFTFGITNTFGYKGFELMVLCTGSYGNDIYNWVRQSNEQGASVYAGRLVQSADYARIGLDGDGNPYVLNSGTHIPRLSPGDGNGNYARASTQWVEDGSYFRVKNIQLSYNFPKAILSKLAIVQSLRMAVGMQNALTVTSYTGYDPEVGAGLNANQSPGTNFIGVDNGRYPSTRMYTFSLNVGF